jgi:phthiodiolone/phenolphthiodiolone dimycocerosates ketoreductase
MASPHIAVGVFVPAQPPLREIGQLALAARMMRLDSMMMWDHLQGFTPQMLWDTDFTWLAARSPSPHAYYDYRTLLGYLGPRAGRVRVGVGVTDVIRQHPVAIAQHAVTLAHMTKRPPIIGLGAGERMNTEPYGMPFEKPVGRLEEALQIIRQCITSTGTFDFDGTHFTLRNAVMDVQPPPGRVPEIWLASHGPRMLALAGRYADGWYPNMFFPEEYAEKLEVIRREARASGRDPDIITPSNQIGIVVARTEREAREMVDSTAGRMLSLTMPAHAWTRLGAEHPFGKDFGGWVDALPETYSRETLEDGLRQVTPEITMGLFFTGTPKQVTAKLREFGEAGMRHTTLILGSALVSQRAALYSLRALWQIRRALA